MSMSRSSARMRWSISPIGSAEARLGLPRLTRAGNFCGHSIDRSELPPYCFNVWTLALIPHDELRGYTPTSVNDAGVILARKMGIPPPRPDVLDHGGKLEPLPSLGAGTLYTGLNDTGDCVGTGEPGDHAILYRHGHVTDLGWFGGTGSLGNALNQRGQVTGVAVGSDGRTGTAFIWTNGAVVDLPALGGFLTTGKAINEAAQVAARPRRAPDVGRGESWALELNGHGDVVGRGRVGASRISAQAPSNLGFHKSRSRQPMRRSHVRGGMTGASDFGAARRKRDDEYGSSHRGGKYSRVWCR